VIDISIVSTTVFELTKYLSLFDLFSVQSKFKALNVTFRFLRVYRF
jgi:hypothetical protein